MLGALTAKRIGPVPWLGRSTPPAPISSWTHCCDDALFRSTLLGFMRRKFRLVDQDHRIARTVDGFILDHADLIVEVKILSK